MARSTVHACTANPGTSEPPAATSKPIHAPKVPTKTLFFAFLAARGRVSLHHAGRELRINDPKLGRLKVTREFVMHHAAKERASLRVDADFPVNLAGQGYCASVASLFWWLYALKVGVGLLSAGGVI